MLSGNPGRLSMKSSTVPFLSPWMWYFLHLLLQIQMENDVYKLGSKKIQSFKIEIVKGPNIPLVHACNTHSPAPHILNYIVWWGARTFHVLSWPKSIILLGNCTFTPKVDSAREGCWVGVKESGPVPDWAHSTCTTQWPVELTQRVKIRFRTVWFRVFSESVRTE